jgi:hypothetical protein
MRGVTRRAWVLIASQAHHAIGWHAVLALKSLPPWQASLEEHMHWKRFIGSTLLALGLLAGCGGAEEVDAVDSAEPASEVTGFATPSTCTDTCDSKYYQCIYSGVPQWTCASNRSYCISQCP